MKRYISLALAAVVLVVSLAVPSHAAELPYLDVLDFTTPNNSGSNVFYCVDGEPVHFDVDVESIRYIEFTVQFISTRVPSCVLAHPYGDLALDVIQLSPYVYRFIGKPVHDFIDGFDLVFSGLDRCKAEFYNLKIATTDLIYDNPIYGDILYGGGEEGYFYYNSWEDRNYVYLPGDIISYDHNYVALIDLPNWKKFDYMDITLRLTNMSISSISALHGDSIIPITYSYMNSSSWVDDTYVSLTLDLTQVDRSLNEIPFISIHGSLPGIDNISANFGVFQSSGVVAYEGMNKALTFWYRSIDFLNEKFDSISSWISAQTASFDSSIGFWTRNIISSLSSISSTIGTWGQNIVNSISSISTWISEQTVAIDTSIGYWTRSVISAVNSVSSRIETWGQAIVDAIVGDQTQNETINNALDTQESVNEQINVQLGSAVDDWDGNVTVVSGGFNTAFQNASPSLNWLSNLAQSVFSGMGWFGNMFFFLGFLHVFFLLMSKSGLGRSIGSAVRRLDSK